MFQTSITYLAICILIVTVSQVNRRLAAQKNTDERGGAEEVDGWGPLWPTRNGFVALLTDKLAFSLMVFIASGIFWIDILAARGFQIATVSHDATLPLALVSAGNYAIAIFSAIQRKSFMWSIVTIIAVLSTIAATLMILSIDAGVCAGISDCPVRRN